MRLNLGRFICLAIGLIGFGVIVWTVAFPKSLIAYPTANPTTLRVDMPFRYTLADAAYDPLDESMYQLFERKNEDSIVRKVDSQASESNWRIESGLTVASRFASDGRGRVFVLAKQNGSEMKQILFGVNGEVSVKNAFGASDRRQDDLSDSSQSRLLDEVMRAPNKGVDINVPQVERRNDALITGSVSGVGYPGLLNHTVQNRTEPFVGCSPDMNLIVVVEKRLKFAYLITSGNRSAANSEISGLIKKAVSYRAGDEVNGLFVTDSVLGISMRSDAVFQSKSNVLYLTLPQCQAVNSLAGAVAARRL